MIQTEEERKLAAQRARRLYDETKHVSRVKDIPDQAHFAVLCEESMNYDDGYGDSQSPSYSTLNYMQYITFASEEALHTWVIENHQKKTFKVLNVKGVTVELRTSLTIRDA